MPSTEDDADLVRVPGRGSAVGAILHQLCPRCRTGRIFRRSIFRGIPKMYERCPVCGLTFEREQGYFLGAMYISYGMGLVTIVAFGLILWLSTHWPLQKVMRGPSDNPTTVRLTPLLHGHRLG